MRRGLDKRRLLLDCLMAVAAVGPLLAGFLSLGRMPDWASALLPASVVGCVLLWWPTRRAHRPRPLVGVSFACFATTASFLANGTLGLGMLWLAALVVARCLGGVAVAVYAAIVVGIGSGVHVILGTPPAQIVVEALGVVMFVLIGGLFAVLLHTGETAERELQRANAELRDRAGSERELVLAQERARTAHGLHDGLGHRLTAIGFSLEFAERARDRDPDRAWEEVERARLTAGDALRDMRRLVRAMHPLDALRLDEGDPLAAIADGFRSSGVAIGLDVEGPLAELPREQMLLLVRFVQEGLTNVVRHAEAERVEILVRVGSDRVEATIADDGGGQWIRDGGEGIRSNNSNKSINSSEEIRDGDEGIPDGRAPELAEGFGLRSLRERSEALGGTFDCVPDATGFRLRVVLPVRPVPSPLSPPHPHRPHQQPRTSRVGS